MPSVETKAVQCRTTRPLYLKRVPADVWERVHVNAIRSGMRLTDYLVSVLAVAEPITTGAGSIPADRVPPMIPSGEDENG